VTLVIPQGYTLSVAGAFAIAVKTYGFPGYGDVWGFVAGAVVAFVVLSIVVRGRLAEAPVELPTGLLSLANVMPLVVVPVVAVMVSRIAPVDVGFPLAGLLGAGGYVFLVSVFFWAVARTQADRPDRQTRPR
jgi:hypothetical protein